MKEKNVITALQRKQTCFPATVYVSPPVIARQGKSLSLIAIDIFPKYARANRFYGKHG